MCTELEMFVCWIDDIDDAGDGPESETAVESNQYRTKTQTMLTASGNGKKCAIILIQCPSA